MLPNILLFYIKIQSQAFNPNSSFSSTEPMKCSLFNVQSKFDVSHLSILFHLEICHGIEVRYLRNAVSSPLKKHPEKNSVCNLSSDWLLIMSQCVISVSTSDFTFLTENWRCEFRMKWAFRNVESSIFEFNPN